MVLVVRVDDSKTVRFFTLEEAQKWIDEHRRKADKIGEYCKAVLAVSNNIHYFRRPPARKLDVCPFCGKELAQLLSEDANAFWCSACMLVFTTRKDDGSLPEWGEPVRDLVDYFAPHAEGGDSELEAMLDEVTVDVHASLPPQEMIDKFKALMDMHTPAYWRDFVLRYGIYDYSLIRETVGDFLRKIYGSEMVQVYNTVATGAHASMAAYDAELSNKTEVSSFWVSLFLFYALTEEDDKGNRDFVHHEVREVLMVSPLGAPLLFALLRVPFLQQHYYHNLVTHMLHKRITDVQAVRLKNVDDYYIDVCEDFLECMGESIRYKKFVLVNRRNEEDATPFALLFFPGVIRTLSGAAGGAVDDTVYVLCDGYLRSEIMQAVADYSLHWVKVLTTQEAAELLVDVANGLITTKEGAQREQ